MTKIMFENEEGLLEIVDSDRIYVDPDAPTDILITVRFCNIKIRVGCPDTDDVESIMYVLFKCDKINLYEIGIDNPELTISVEEDNDIESFFGAMDEALAEYLGDSEDYPEDYEQDGE